MKESKLYALPYYAVIFTTEITGNMEGYEETAARMEDLAREQPGYLGIESARSELGITVSYWKDEESIRAWKSQMDHAAAREKGRLQWYAAYTLRVAKVERQYDFSAE
jgi:heme-degrading monooxygenase HmoA